MARKYTPKNKFPKLTADQRAKIVDLKRQQVTGVLKISDAQMANDFNCDRKTIRNTWKKWNETSKVTSIKQTGRKTLLNRIDRQNLKKACMHLPFQTARYFRDHPMLNLKKASVDTIKRELRKLGLPAFIARTRNKLQKRHKTARIKFAEEKLNFDWKKVLFSDEKIFQNFCNGRNYVRRPRGQAWKDKYVIRMDRTRRFKVNLWGIISPLAEECKIVYIEGEPKKEEEKNKKKKKVQGIHTAKSYLKVLEDVQIEKIASREEGRVFMQDNASIHTTTAVMSYLNERVDTLSWPSLSPDLNPIENVWSQMQRKMHEKMRLGLRLRNVDQLLTLAKRSFYEVCNQNYLNKLYESMSKRIKSVIEEKGERTKY